MSSTSPVDTFKGLTRNDQIFLGTGVLTFIFSFIDFAKVHVTGSALNGFSGSAVGGSISAWHGVGTLAALLILVAVVVAAVAVFAPSALASWPASARLIAVGAAALGLLFFLIRWLTLPSESFAGLHAGYKLAWGGYVTLILNIVMLVVGFLAFRAAGEALPWENRGTSAAAGSTAAPSAPPAAPASQAPVAPESPAATEPPPAPIV